MTVDAAFPEPGRIVSRSRTVVDQVHELMLDAIASGELVAGDDVHDQEWAERLNVSRTPIREAIKRLEGHGVIDIAAARYTRIISFTPETARLEAQSWATVHLAIASSLCGATDRAAISKLRALRGRVYKAGAARRPAASFAFFTHLRTEAASFAMRLAATAASYRLVLAQPLLHEHHDADLALTASLITALQKNAPGPLHAAFANWAEAATRAEPMMRASA
ncbi:GntR family transcriptional regulator [Agromyces aerolatus]|uniref:GntR family transcriptional regulator n=1 Tax=Agromyces sp. LY-1074 TaxID=3074080 RepID=UPI00285FA59D|nr:MULTISPECIES: GntR family transcriptional regulator [unclassified Agromyces]MDR5699382.1 GntR family transcriptional regulator [Agromyces sp. LY-1074]MDR5705678.1 GntR family transcriptional regulator [Agromyces sp. LY-1358]